MTSVKKRERRVEREKSVGEGDEVIGFGGRGCR